MIGGWLRFLNRRKPHPACRLTESAALAIARAELGGDAPLSVLDVVAAERGPEWRIGTATIGSGVVLRIDDATGKVIARQPWGVR